MKRRRSSTVHGGTPSSRTVQAASSHTVTPKTAFTLSYPFQPFRFTSESEDEKDNNESEGSDHEGVEEDDDDDDDEDDEDEDDDDHTYFIKHDLSDDDEYYPGSEGSEDSTPSEDSNEGIGFRDISDPKESSHPLRAGSHPQFLPPQFTGRSGE